MLNQGAAVFNCGSVTLWPDKDELIEFATRNLLGRFGEVVVVPDSDWATNRDVLRQTNTVRSHLEGLGLHVIAAAPPAKCGDVCLHVDDRRLRKAHKNGVDDLFEHPGRYSLDSLIVPVPQPQRLGIQASRRVRRLLEESSRLADPLGYACASWDDLAGRMEVNRLTVRNAIYEAEDAGYIEYDAPEPERGKPRKPGTIRLREDLRPTFDYERLGSPGARS